MRDYGKIYTRFWTSPDISQLSLRAKLIAVYLLSSPHTTMIGCFRIRTAYIADDLGISLEQVTEGLLELSRIGFIKRDEPLSLVMICNFLNWNPIENPNQAKAAAKLVEQLPKDSSLRQEVLNALASHKGFSNGSTTVSKPGTGTEAVTEAGKGARTETEEGTGDCAETNSAHDPKPIENVVFTLPLNDGSDFSIYEGEAKQYEDLYPAVNLMQELRNMKGWLHANPRNRKTRSGIDRFVNHWLSKAQNAARPAGGSNGFFGSNTASKAQQRSTGNLEALASVLSEGAYPGSSCASGGDATSIRQQGNSQGLLDAPLR